MTEPNEPDHGANEPDHGEGGWGPEDGDVTGSHGHPSEGAEGAELGSDYPPGDGSVGSVGSDEDDESDEVVDAEVLDDEVLDEADVSAAVDEAFADDDPLALALNQRDEYLDSLRRLQAEFENYRKRVAKQQADQVARAALSLVDKVLPVLDTLDLATQHVGDADSADGRALVAVANQLREVLTKEGLERIDPIGEVFDPNAHEAVGHLPADETDDVDGPEGSEVTGAGGEPVVGQVMRAGYRWRGSVVRPAMVMVRG
jgi:molecular chaperone GrpE